MICPRCQTKLQRGSIAEPHCILVLDTCPECGGTWFEHGDLHRLDQIIEPTFLEIRHIPSPEEQMKGLPCPCCGEIHTMKKAEHNRDKKVVFDYCPRCKGIWLDCGELEAIQKENWILTLVRLFRFVTGLGNSMSY